MGLFSVNEFAVYLVNDDKNILFHCQINQSFDLSFAVEITCWITGVTDQYGSGLVSDSLF